VKTLAVASVEELDTRSYDATITYRCTPPATVSQGQSESHTQATSRNLSVTFCASRALFPMNARSRLSLPRSMRHARPCGQCRVLSRTYTTCSSLRSMVLRAVADLHNKHMRRGWSTCSLRFMLCLPGLASVGRHLGLVARRECSHSSSDSVHTARAPAGTGWSNH
jgi:hypothetical protein